LYSPYKPTVEETIKPLLSTPDLSMEIENLISNIEEVHKINITTLGQELQALDIDIQNELVDLSKVNEVLQKTARIKEITIFDPTDINLDKITESTTALKLVTWSVAILSVGFIIFCIISCCPIQIFTLLKATLKAILALLTCTCTTAFITTSSITRFMRKRRQNHLHTSPVTDSELNESPDQPSATVKYVPHPTFRRRLFQGEEDSENELTIYSTQENTSPPPYHQNSKTKMYPDVPSAPNITSSETLQLGKPRQHNTELQEHNWEIIRANNLGAKLTKQNSKPALFFHNKTNKVYTLEGNEMPVEGPPRTLIIEYQDTLQTLPQLSLDQIRRLLANDTIEYDKNLKAYYTPVKHSGKRFYHFAYRSLQQPN
jgi:hypothetical protein